MAPQATFINGYAPLRIQDHTTFPLETLVPLCLRHMHDDVFAAMPGWKPRDQGTLATQGPMPPYTHNVVPPGAIPRYMHTSTHGSQPAISAGASTSANSAGGFREAMLHQTFSQS